MKLFNLHPTYLSKNQFVVYSIAFWLIVIGAIVIAKYYGIYGGIS